MLEVYDLMMQLSDEYKYDADDNDTYDEISDRLSNVVASYEDAIQELLEDGLIQIKDD